MNIIKSETSEKTDELSIDDKKAIEFVSVLTQLELTALIHKKDGLAKSIRYSANKVLERTDDVVLRKVLLNIINHANPVLHLKVMRKRLEEVAGGKVHW